ncbi:hypothetical protein Q4Q34_18395 [Flavivirga abyssicola]|uniref:hypothetical protein n=1 Tax=Flavivirga abyssicola TaxID=3063533 RepID=UPI0026DEFEB3|nr:hypothetical protein [Flavivirga sp. MEBiC07777]WVK13187.1 hypothetical protein Q4Q34_18395 [Flavivirga sp. MEBiC07777]
MKKLLLFTISLFVLMSCGGKKQVEAAVNSGNYDQAITTALNKLRTNKNKKRKFDYVLMLQDAYHKAAERDLNSIEHLKKDKNPELYREIYELYMDLNARQEAIKPILPLNINGRNVSFNFSDYSNDIVQSRETVSNYLYEKGLDLLELEDKAQIREAYNVLNYVESINPNYELTRDLMKEAHERGTAYVSVTIENSTNQIIPQRLEEDLLNFDTYGLNQFWTVYHAQPNKEIAYDYAMQLHLKQINISPEHIKEREYIREKEIVDGWKYELDSKGNVVKDSLGNDIKIDKIVKVKARYNEFTQIKSTQVIADVLYLDIKTKQLLDTFTIDSEFIFENLFARIRGDKRALNSEDRRILNNRRVPFPSNEQMVYDTGEDLKLKLKNIISSYRVKV